MSDKTPERPTKWPAKVHVSQFPDKELEVDEAEWTNLSASGLLVDAPPPERKSATGKSDKE